MSSTNAPERFLSWRFEDPSSEGSKRRLQYLLDSKKPNAGTFILAKEDHTLGNLLRLQLLRDPSVRFAGYRMPHPLVTETHLRVETMDSKFTSIQAFESALGDLQLEVHLMDRSFDAALTEFEYNRGI